MGPPVGFQNLVTKVFHAEAQPGDAEFFERMNLWFGERARFAFERDLFGLVPVNVGPQSIDESFELFAAEEARRAAAEVDEAERPSTHDRLFADQFDLAGECGQILFDLLGVLVGVDLEVAELAPLAAEGDVQIEPERDVAGRRGHRLLDGRQRVTLPLRIGRVVGNEVTTHFGFDLVGAHVV